MGKASRIRLKAKCKARHFNLDENTLTYYLKIEETLKQDFENEELKDLFIRNVLKQLSDEVFEVCLNPSICPIVDNLLKLANPDELFSILMVLSKDWEKVCCSKTLSFPAQTVLRCCNKFLGSSTCSLLETIESLVSFLQESLALYMQHTSASHILRTILQVLSGINSETRNKNNNSVVLKETSTDCKKLLKKICTKILNLPKLEDHVQNYMSCPVLQSVLICCKALDEATQRDFHLRILNEGKLFEGVDKTLNLPSNVTHPYSSHLMEVWISNVEVDLFRQTFKKHFKGKLFAMAKHPMANFVLQRLISSSKNSKQFGRMFKELSSGLEDIFACNHLKLVLTIAENCLKHDYKQKLFVKQLQTAFHCLEPNTRKKKKVPTATLR